MTDKFTNRLWVTVNADVELCGYFVPEYRSSSQVRLDVNPMRRNHVNQPLIATEFSTWKSHARIIVKNDYDVKHLHPRRSTGDPYCCSEHGISPSPAAPRRSWR